MNMRCSVAATQALAMHPQFWQRDEVKKEAMDMAESGFKNLNCTFLLNMPAANARSILEPEIPRLIKTQRPSGMWKIKDNRRISYDVLKALKHAGLLASLLNEDRFRHDPFRSFHEENDFYGLVVRRNIMEAPLPGDSELQGKLASEIFELQEADGSWNGTAISTSNHIEKLAEMGIGLDNKYVEKGADWLFSICEEDVLRLSKNIGDVVVAHHMFSSEDRRAEFMSAVDEKPEWNPVGLCYLHLPMIQTGSVLKALMKLGLENDERVIAACENLLELKQNYGGWCDTNIRNGLAAKMKSRK